MGGRSLLVRVGEEREGEGRKGEGRKGEGRGGEQNKTRRDDEMRKPTLMRRTIQVPRDSIHRSARSSIMLDTISFALPKGFRRLPGSPWTPIPTMILHMRAGRSERSDGRVGTRSL